MWIGCMVMNEAHRAGPLRLAWVCMQGHHMSWLACCSIRFELKEPLCLPGRVSFSWWHGRCSTRSWPGTLITSRKRSRFAAAGPSLALRSTKGFCLVSKEMSSWVIGAIREKTREVMLAKPVRGPLITVDLTPPADGEMNYIFMYTFSGSLFSSRNWFTVVLSASCINRTPWHCSITGVGLLIWRLNERPSPCCNGSLFTPVFSFHIIAQLVWLRAGSGQIKDDQTMAALWGKMRHHLMNMKAAHWAWHLANLSHAHAEASEEQQHKDHHDGGQIQWTWWEPAPKPAAKNSALKKPAGKAVKKAHTKKRTSAETPGTAENCFWLLA